MLQILVAFNIGFGQTVDYDFNGDYVFCSLSGPIKLVCVNNLETALEVLVKKSKDFAGRQEMVSGKLIVQQYQPLGTVNTFV